MADDSPRHILDLTRRERAAFIVLVAILLGGLALRVVQRANWRRDRPRVIAAPKDVDYRIDLNTATWQELCWLPGIGEKVANAIVQHREEHGPFTSPDDLVKIRNIGPALVEKLRPFVVARRPAQPTQGRPRAGTK